MGDEFRAVVLRREAELRRALELERDCDFDGAAKHALLGGEPRRALRLAALGANPETIRACIASVLADSSPDRIRATATEMEAAGYGAIAGELYAAVEDDGLAALAFAAGGEARKAATHFERAGQPVDAARALELALQKQPDDHGLRVVLASLLERFGRHEAAARTLQAIPVDAAERPEALPALHRLLNKLGFSSGAELLEGEMRDRGVLTSATPKAPVVQQEGDAGHVMYGRYDVVSEVALSPMARVYQARDRIDKRVVAIKVLRTSLPGAGRDAAARFMREAAALEQLRHPSVARLLRFVADGPALVLEWMNGGNLRELIDRGPIAPARAAEICRSVLGALGHAHRLGILHRDVKPSNILFDDVGAPRLSDFGVAHLGDLASTVTAATMGTLSYMSPEQRAGRPAGVKSDLFGVGVVLVEMIAGFAPEPVEDEPSFSALSEAHPELDAAHDAFAARLLSVDPERRPVDAFDGLEQLDRLAWPVQLEPRRHSHRVRISERPPSAPSERLRVLDSEVDGLQPAVDLLLGRPLALVAISDASLRFARAIGIASHQALPVILRADETSNQLWLQPPLGVPDAPRSQFWDRAAWMQLSEAVAALHDAGAAHGSIDEAHIHWHSGQVEITWPEALVVADEASFEADRRAVERLKPR